MSGRSRLAGLFFRYISMIDVDLRLLAGLKRLLPGLHLVVGHDHTDYQWKHLAPHLSKGWLAADERRAMADYEASLFDGDGTLRPEAMPRFETAKGGGVVGTVSEPRPV